MIKFNESMGPAQGISMLNNMVNALDFWQDTTTINVGDVVRSSTDNMIYAVATAVHGPTGTVEPVWGKVAGVSIVDGGVTWLVKDARVADRAVTADKFTMARKINGISFDGTQDIVLPSDTLDNHSYIASGLKVSGASGLNLSVASGTAKITGQNVLFNGGSLALDARKATLAYLGVDGTLGKVNAAYPIANIDDHTVGMWIFNQTTAGANIPNSAVGKSAIAVANDLVPTGGITSVDGWADPSLRLDGTTGYFTGSNLTGFPTGAAEREMSIMYTVNGLGTPEYLMSYGAANTGASFMLNIATSGYLSMSMYNVDILTNFMLEVGRTYLITCKYDGANIIVFVNGTRILKYAYTCATTSAFFLVGNVPSFSFYSNVTLHYCEIRNKMRTDQQTAQIANALMLPAYYYKNQATAPTVPSQYSAVYHEYLFSDASGTAVADSNTANPMAGTATGTTIATSEIGLANQRNFNGTSSDKITLGTFACGNLFSMQCVVDITSYAAVNPLWSNATSTTSGISIYIDTSGHVVLYSGGTANTIYSATVPFGKAQHIAVTVNGKTAKFYLNNVLMQTTVISAVLQATSNVAYIGYMFTPYYLKGSVQYLMFGAFELTQAEIGTYYDALMSSGRLGFLDDIVPANGTAIAFVRSGSSAVIEYNDTDYKYGRREGATGGNRKVFLGWQWFSGETTLKWQNPFNSKKLSLTFNWAQDPNGTNEVSCMSMFYSGGMYGITPVSYVANGYNDAQNICAHGFGGVTQLNGTWQTSGYIGCYAEVLEDYQGV